MGLVYIGIFFAGLGIFFVGIGFLWAVSLYNKKLKSEKGEIEDKSNSHSK
ncbi:hypothetical protein MUN89_18160 [Halobacillus salinarum]|uniref:Uncharacterized protein n=1 Tax=Halobacillus salinarum TaxID=2932257 RepID=A0ABY4EI90_9BACI|nr:hypothetical protein [Halobacillus salinarum]UOQ43783.1 hypothetical protein MUN89_18160 [Halobacillus salinarum]